MNAVAHLSNLTVPISGNSFHAATQPRSDAIQTYETFSSVSILLLDLADSLEDKPRLLAMANYQLSEMGLLLAEKALDQGGIAVG